MNQRRAGIVKAIYFKEELGGAAPGLLEEKEGGAGLRGGGASGEDDLMASVGEEALLKHGGQGQILDRAVKSL